MNKVYFKKIGKIDGRREQHRRRVLHSGGAALRAGQRDGRARRDVAQRPRLHGGQPLHAARCTLRRAQSS